MLRRQWTAEFRAQFATGKYCAWVVGIQTATFIPEICRAVRLLARAEAAAGSPYVTHPTAGFAAAGHTRRERFSHFCVPLYIL